MFAVVDCSSPAAALLISVRFHFKDSLSSADILWYAVLTSLFFCTSYCPR